MNLRLQRPRQLEGLGACPYFQQYIGTLGFENGKCGFSGCHTIGEPQCITNEPKNDWPQVRTRWLRLLLGYRWWAAAGLFAGALFIVGLRYGIAMEARHQQAALVPAPAGCMVPAPADSGLLVIPAGVIR